VVHEIVPDEVEGWLRRGARLIDVREPWEYAQGHIPGAQNIPLGRLDSHLATLEGPVVFVCASGNRSGQAARHLAEQGQGEVANLLGGTAAWRQRGLPLE
jgi:rhodanese-related sulfurtransferase